MTIETWTTFTVACAVLTLIPGPSVMLVVGKSLSLGWKAAMLCIVGDMIGGVVLMGLSFAGVGAILASSALLFQIVKWAGVFYLAYLGYSQIKAARQNDNDLALNLRDAASAWESFWAGAVTAILNPKAIIFYMAFLTQFVNPTENLTLQMTVLIATSTAVVAILLAGYAFLASRARVTFESKIARRRIGYTGGSIMLGGSAFMAVSR